MATSVTAESLAWPLPFRVYKGFTEIRIRLEKQNLRSIILSRAIQAADT